MCAVLHSLLGTLSSFDVGHHVLTLNSASGRPQFSSAHSYVCGAIEALGGIDAASRKLKVTVVDINKWIDEHYVPSIHAKKIRALVGYDLLSLQEAPFYVFDGTTFWPHVPKRSRIKDSLTGAVIYPTPPGLWSSLLPRSEFQKQARMIASKRH